MLIAEDGLRGIPEKLPDAFVKGLFSDDVWRLANPAAGDSVKRFDWPNMKLADGTLLGDDVNRDLLLGIKSATLFRALGKGGSKRHGPLKPGSLYLLVQGLMRLADWMVKARNIRSFQSLTLVHVLGYRNHLTNALRDRRLKTATVSARLAYVKVLCRLQPEMGSLGTRFSPRES